MILEHHISRLYHISIIWYNGSSFIQPSIHQGYQLQTKQGLTSESCRHNISALTQTITFIRRVLWSPDRVNLYNQYKSKNSQKHFMLIYLYGYIYIYMHNEKANRKQSFNFKTKWPLSIIQKTKIWATIDSNIVILLTTQYAHCVQFRLN